MDDYHTPLSTLILKKYTGFALISRMSFITLEKTGFSHLNMKSLQQIIHSCHGNKNTSDGIALVQIKDGSHVSRSQFKAMSSNSEECIHDSG